MIVQACQRAERGGSPTAVLDETPSSDAERRAVPVEAGTSHAVFVSTERRESGVRAVSLRFFTATGELPACGHGTVAALAMLAERAGTRDYEAMLSAGGRTFLGRATGGGGRYEAAFDPGPVELRTPVDVECAGALRVGHRPRGGVDRVSDRLGGTAADAGARPRPGRPRGACAGPGPAAGGVRPAGSARLLRVQHAVPGRTRRGPHVRPSIGVPEDIANANSTACLAALLAEHGASALAVDMGDSLGRPATVTATARPGPDGPQVFVGGTATTATDGSVA